MRDKDQGTRDKIEQANYNEVTTQFYPGSFVAVVVVVNIVVVVYIVFVAVHIGISYGQ